MRKIYSMILILALSFSITSCTNISAIDTNQNQNQNTDLKSTDLMDKGPVKGGLVRLFSTKPDTLNPLLTKNVYVQDFLDLVFEGMVKLGVNQEPIPSLADNWNVSSDGLIWTFHIRENVIWHNNVPLTAEDVKFTFDSIQDINFDSYYKKNLANISIYTAIDRYTFRIFLKKPDANTPGLMTFPILQKYYFTGEEAAKKDSLKNMEPVGTGPYKYVATNGSNVIKLVANDNWWSVIKNTKDQPNYPYIQEIDVKIYESSKDIVSAFQNKDIDVAPVQSVDFNRYEGRTDLILKKYPGKNYEFIALNLNKPALSDKSVRQAMAYAIDKDTIIDTVLPGEAVPSDMPLIPETIFNDKNINAYVFDTNKARDILAKGGWQDENGVMFKKINGVKTYLKFELLVNDNNATRFKVAVKISEQLKKIGIIVNIFILSWNDVINNVNIKKYDMAIMGYSISSAPDVSFAYASSQISTGWNVSGYRNSVIDTYLEQIATVDDQNQRKTIFSNMKNLIIDDVPYIGLYFYDNAMIFNKKIRGEMNPYLWNKYNDITKWYIPNN